MFASTYQYGRPPTPAFPIPGDARAVTPFDSAFVKSLVFFVLLAATTYQLILCFIHTHVFNISATTLGVFEFMIYAVCRALLVTRLRLEFVAVITLIASYLLLMTLLRAALDAKGFRDLIIPVLFYALGQGFGSIKRGDKVLKILIVLVLAIGFFELLAVDTFSRVFNIFSYYVNQGGLAGAINYTEGTLAVNGLRPEGIGRTILPSLLGAHRVSSLFLEPVSLGNFATIVAAWGLSKDRSELKAMMFYLVCAAIMITLCDSRYGSIALLFLIAMRVLLRGRARNVVIIMPFVTMIFLLGLALFQSKVTGDNVSGRLFITGQVLANFGAGEMMGLKSFDINYGDMGYANVLTKFGMILCIALWLGFWLIRMSDERGNRFRAYVAVYASLILTVSGTSFFALKTAGVLWFLVGCCAAHRSIMTDPVVSAGTAPGSGKPSGVPGDVDVARSPASTRAAPGSRPASSPPFNS